jgi:4-hydroxy-tetrahydrodipicolinate synthase
MKIFRGCYTALITPFTDSGDFDPVAFEKIIEFQIDSGIDGLVILGTTGESPTITPSEHDQIVRLSVQIVAGRVPVIAGTGSNCTREAVEHSQAAERAGVNGLLQVNPYYNKPTQKGLYTHFSTIAESVKIPIILYNIAGRTGVNLETPTLLRLSQYDNIVGVKEASGNLEQIQEVIDSVPKDFSVFSGDDGLTLAVCEKGGDGVISVASNIFPAEMTDFVRACLSGDLERARALEEKYREFFEACFIETNPQPIKTLMAEAGFCAPRFRSPMIPMEEKNREKLLSVYRKNLKIFLSDD